MGIYQREGRWMVYYFENGKRRDKSFGRGEEARSQAEQFDNERREKTAPAPIEPNTSNQSTVASAAHINDSCGMTFRELANKYIVHMKVSGRSANNIAKLDKMLQNQFYPLIGDRAVNKMTYLNDALPFIEHFQNTNGSKGRLRSQNTVNRYGDYLNAIFNFGVKTGVTTSNPMMGRSKSKVPPRKVQLTVDDVKMIMTHADQHVRWAMEVCFNLGTRPGESELLALRWENVSLDKGVVLIYGAKTKTFREVPVNPEFVERLRAKRAEAKSDFVVEYKGQQVGMVRKGFKRACERAGITYPVRMYDLRHLFATTMLSKGGDLAAVSKLMGHSTIKMTADVYYHCQAGEKERAVSLLPSLMG